MSQDPAEPGRHRVFVYGTLLRGLRNHHWLEGSALVARTALAERFTMLDCGSYPALVEGAEQRIAGEVYVVSDHVLAQLDELEEYPSYYDRKIVDLEDGTRAWVYVLTSAGVAEHADAPVVPGADWESVERSRR